MNGGTCLVAEVDDHRIERRIETRYLDEVAPDTPSAVRSALDSSEALPASRRPRSSSDVATRAEW